MKTIPGRCFAVLFIVLLSFSSLTIFNVEAQARTIIVPDDYPTIQEAIDASRDGDTIFVREGTYNGPINQTLTITKSISIKGENPNTTKINLYPPYKLFWIITSPQYTYYDAIAINANDVKISNLTLYATPGGSMLASGDRIQITNNKIRTGTTAIGLTVSGSYCNIIDNTSTGDINIRGSNNEIIQNNINSIHLKSGNSNFIGQNKITFLQVGSIDQTCLHNIISGNRIDTNEKISHAVSVRNSAHNIFDGNYIDVGGGGYNLRFYGSEIENNMFYHNSFIGMNGPLDADLVVTGNFWDNENEGNYWDYYNGTDINRDGIGDTPYVIGTSNVDNYPLMFPYDVENDTIVIPPPEPFPTTLAVFSVAILVVIVFGFLTYYKKRRS